MSSYFKPHFGTHTHNFTHTETVAIVREGGDIGLFITQVPKVFNNIFLFVDLTTMGTFIEFLMFSSFSLVCKRFNH